MSILYIMIYTARNHYTIFFYTLIILLLLIDLGQFFLLGKIVIPLLLCAYCILLYHGMRYQQLPIAFLQCLEYFCFYNFFSLACLYLIPITMITVFFKKYLYPSPIHIIALTLIALIIQIYAIEGYFLGILPSTLYTIMRINATLFLTICFSLTINIWGMQDNRA